MILWTYLVIGLSLVFYQATSFYCGFMRGKHKIMAPAMTGHPDFERAVRIHLNTMENLVAFIPAVWIFAIIVNPMWAAILGAIWLAGRILYAVAYMKDPTKRGPGFGIAFLPLAALILGDVFVALAELTMGAAR